MPEAKSTDSTYVAASAGDSQWNAGREEIMSHKSQRVLMARGAELAD